MRRFILAFSISFWSVVALAQLPWQSGIGTPVTAASFTGVGDTHSAGMVRHYGSIAYSSATRGQNMYNICDANTGTPTCKNIATDASTGLVSSTQSVGSIGTCGSGANQCYIKIACDDVNSVCTLTNGTSAAWPRFIPNAIGSIPGIGCVAASFLVLSGDNLNASAPVSIGATVSTTTVTSGTLQGIADANGLGALLYFSGDNPTKSSFYEGAELKGSLPSVNTFYSNIGTSDGAGNGTIAQNGTTTTGAIGTNTTSGSSPIHICKGNSGDGVSSLDGTVIEVFWNTTDISSNIAALTTTMRANAGN